MTLEFARSLPVEVGANRRGEQVDSCWLFLLPSLDLGQVAIVGDAPPGTAPALSAIAREVVHVDLRSAILPASLIYVGHRAVSSIAHDEERLARLRSALHAGSSVFFGPGAPVRDLDAVIASLDVQGEVILAPGSAEPAARVPAATAGWRVPAPRQSTGARHRAEVALRLVVAKVARVLGARLSRGADRVSEAGAAIGVGAVLSTPPRAARGEGLLLRGGEAGALPEYVREIAAAAGRPLAHDRWRIAPPRGYRSQKVIFFVCGTDGSQAVVKLTQDRRFNALLDNEAHALEALARAAPAHGPLWPQLLFTGTHAGLSVVAEEALAGRAFVHVAAGGAHCTSGAAAAAALTGLGVATKRHAGDVVDAIEEIADAYVELFRPSSAAAARLRRAQRSLAALESDLPLVFMHGDATVFNVLVSDGGQIGFVDWENAEALGMPLWDLMHFLTTHYVWSEERSGRRARPADVALALSTGRGLDPLRRTALDAYVQKVGVPVQAVGPLWLMWAARHALRDARQLSPAALQRSFHHRLVEQMSGAR